MRKLFFSMIMIIPCLAVNADDGKGVFYTGREYIIVVPERGSAVKSLIEKARAEKGVILFYSGSAVRMRVPVAGVDAVESAIKSIGYIDDEKITRADVGEELAVLKARLEVKNNYIAKLYKLTQDANLGGTLNAEKAIETASVERDSIRSSIKRLERMARYSDIYVTVNGPGEGGAKSRSRFGFINALGMDNLTGDLK